MCLKSMAFNSPITTKGFLIIFLVLTPSMTIFRFNEMNNEIEAGVEDSLPLTNKLEFVI